MSNFERVVDFNFSFGVIPSREFTPQRDVFDQDPKKVEFCLKLIREECKELEQAVKEKDYVETVDALADILYVVYGMGARIGVDLDRAFDLVHLNNLSKLCSTEEEAQRSVQYYKEHPELGYESPEYRKAPNNIHWVVYNKSTNKILKSIEWKPVDLRPVC
jgi:predicted HAD superfamily Cof-like phosphohydrolase